MIGRLPSLALAAALAVPSAARAQEDGWFVGAGAGASVIDRGYDAPDVTRPHVRLMAGKRLSRYVSVALEGTAYGLFDEEPRVSDFPPGSTDPLRSPVVVGTQTLFAAVQVEVAPDFYLRPGVGLSRHSYAAYFFGPGDQVQDAWVGHEAGPAAGLTVGYAFPLGANASLALEGVGVWSHGQDSAASRWVYGVQIAPTFPL